MRSRSEASACSSTSCRSAAKILSGSATPSSLPPSASRYPWAGVWERDAPCDQLSSSSRPRATNPGRSCASPNALQQGIAGEQVGDGRTGWLRDMGELGDGQREAGRELGQQPNLRAKAVLDDRALGKAKDEPVIDEAGHAFPPFGKIVERLHGEVRKGRNNGSSVPVQAGLHSLRISSENVCGMRRAVSSGMFGYCSQ